MRFRRATLFTCPECPASHVGDGEDAEAEPVDRDGVARERVGLWRP